MASNPVDDYLKKLPLAKQQALREMRAVLRAALPEAEEVISYSMPAFRQEGIVAWYAAASKHYALYVYPRVKQLFADQLKPYKGTKSAIHFEYDKPLPKRLVARIVKESLKQNLAKAKKVV